MPPGNDSQPHDGWLTLFALISCLIAATAAAAWLSRR
jgi:hypothetical protein